MRCIQVAVVAILGFFGEWALADVTIRGRVAGQDGEPVGGAVVFCLKPDRGSFSVASVDGKTNAEGLFELRLAGFDDTTELKPQSVLIYSAGHGLGVTTVGALLEASAGVTPVTVTLPAETAKTFRVLDPQGRPVAGAVVDPVNYLYGSPATSTNYGMGCKLPDALAPMLGGITDELGVVKLKALTADKLRTIQVVCEQYGQQEAGNPARIDTIRLQPTARAEIVFDQTNGGMGRCRIVAFTSPMGGAVPFAGPGATPKERAGVGVHYAVLSAGAKRVDMPAMAAGLLNFRLTDGSNEERVLPVWPQRILLEPGTSRTITVPMEKTITIRGRVLDETNRPRANVAVVVMNDSRQNNVIVTRTDGEGRYRCNVLKGQVQVSATLGDPTAVIYGLIPKSTLRKEVLADAEFSDCILTADRVRQ